MSTITEPILEFDAVSPRVVADIQNVDFQIRYIRDDVAERYTDADLDEAYRVIMGNLVAGDDFKSLIGEQECRVQTLFFDDILVCVFPSDRYEAVFASFDYDEEFPVNRLVKRVSDSSSAE